jgi:hypothetical protein
MKKTWVQCNINNTSQCDTVKRIVTNQLLYIMYIETYNGITYAMLVNTVSEASPFVDKLENFEIYI